MPEPTAADPQPTDARRGAPLALLAAVGDAAAGLEARLAEAGFEVARVTPDEAARAAGELSPACVLVAFGAREEQARLVSLARRLRARPETFALPVVFLFREDSRTLRSAAEHFGADDYFPQGAPAAELRARLEALLWRSAAGRRAAPAAAEQRSEIDNFIFLLDAVGADARDGERGTVALVEAAGDGRVEDDERALRAAHGFLKLNLRRVDAVAFYGPTTLVVYLARADAASARGLLAGLREEFLDGRPRADLRAGLASFPADGVEVEGLIERAESALAAARRENSPARVLVYEGGAGASSGARPAPGARLEPGRRSAPQGSGAAPSLNKASRGEGRETSTTPREAAGARQADARGRRAKARHMMLIVSDAARMTQVNLLMRSAGYEVRAAFDGEHALGLLRIDRPDLLLVDYELHGMDGVEMLRRLGKQSGHKPAPPAVVLLPGGREDLRREALAAGARAAVALPYDPVELLEALENVGDRE